MAETGQVRLPREGEWWEKVSCPKDHPLPGIMKWGHGVTQWRYTTGEYTEGRIGLLKPEWDAIFEAEKAAVECGCLRHIAAWNSRHECVSLVREFFKGDAAKVEAWLLARNPLLGNVTPMDLIETGRAQRLLTFIRIRLFENEMT